MDSLIDLVADYWYVWIIATIISFGIVSYSKWKAGQQKDFIVTGSAIIGCFIVGFQFIGAISAVLTIIACIFKLLLWWLTS